MASSLRVDSLERVAACLTHVTVDIHNCNVGSDGDRAATVYLEAQFRANGWTVDTRCFDAIDRQGTGVTLTSADGTTFGVFSSPYSLGYKASARLQAVSTVEDLEAIDASDALLPLHGGIAHEPLVSRNYPFFSVDKHHRIIARLEDSGATAILCATAPMALQPAEPIRCR